MPTKEEILDYLDMFDDDEEIDINDLISELNYIKQERHQMLIEELEERQHQSGFYAFQDKMAMWRYER